MTNADNRGTSADVFVAKCVDATASGSWAWVQRGGGSYNDNVTAIAASGGSVYVAGYYPGAATFGSTVLPNAGSGIYNPDVFVAKLTDSGAWTWAQRAGGSDSDLAFALAVSGPDVFVAGYFEATATFGSVGLSSAGSSDVFVAKLRDAGPSSSWVWGQQAGGTRNDGASALTLHGTQVYVGSRVRPPAAFGAFPITSPSGSTNTVGVMAALTDATLSATGVAAKGDNLAVFPNPAQGTVRIRLPEVKHSARLTMVDALGRVVRSQQIDAHESVDMASLPRGLYFVQVETAGQLFHCRLVLE